MACLTCSCGLLVSAISRKDTYGVFSEPVDSSLVCVPYLHVQRVQILVSALALFLIPGSLSPYLKVFFDFKGKVVLSFLIMNMEISRFS
jgi:hypothetical protein